MSLSLRPSLFQSTQPSQAVTQPCLMTHLVITFQSTQPSQAVTYIYDTAYRTDYIFQSTQPSQAVTCFYADNKNGTNISIHTALAGCDIIKRCLSLIICLFQSTQPSQAVTICFCDSFSLEEISIHTALAGCDGCQQCPKAGANDFNPHSPRRL